MRNFMSKLGKKIYVKLFIFVQLLKFLKLYFIYKNNYVNYDGNE